MKTYTISEAQKNLPALLKEAEEKGYAVIQGGAGQAFIVKPQMKPNAAGKPLRDIPSVDLGITREEIVEIVRQGRERWPRYLDE